MILGIITFAWGLLLGVALGLDLITLINRIIPNHD